MNKNDDILVKLETDPTYREVFTEIVRKKSVRLHDLKSAMRNLGEERTEAYLKTFTDANLVKELKSQVHDFNTYYITAIGLQAGRRLAR